MEWKMRSGNEKWKMRKRETRRNGDEHFAEQVSQVCENRILKKKMLGGTHGIF